MLNQKCVVTPNLHLKWFFFQGYGRKKQYKCATRTTALQKHSVSAFFFVMGYFCAVYLVYFFFIYISYMFFFLKKRRLLSLTESTVLWLFNASVF